ncbi:hypothetical protein OIO90_000363 [Microbotryomycetes sp. JL221]|nr:hypothetical protein OIO90_000363 [Microbotryomycetes sp. JL221]
MVRPNVIIQAGTLAPVAVLSAAVAVAASTSWSGSSNLSLLVARQAAPTCVISCIGTSSSATDCSSADAQCLCMSESFITAVATCLSNECSEQDQLGGIQFGEQLCQAAGHPVTIPTGIAESVASLTESATTSEAEATSSGGGDQVPTSAQTQSESVPATTSSPSSAPTASGTTVPSASPTSAGSKLAGSIGLVFGAFGLLLTQ